MSRKQKKNKPIKNCQCETCENLMAIGEGDHICTEGEEPKVVIEDYMPAKDYLWCKGGRYSE